MLFCALCGQSMEPKPWGMAWERWFDGWSAVSKGRTNSKRKKRLDRHRYANRQVTKRIIHNGRYPANGG